MITTRWPASSRAAGSPRRGAEGWSPGKHQEGQTKLKKIDEGSKAFLKAEKTALAERSVSETAKYMVAAWKMSAKMSAKEALAATSFRSRRSLGQVPAEAACWGHLRQLPGDARSPPRPARRRSKRRRRNSRSNSRPPSKPVRRQEDGEKGQDELLTGPGEKGPFIRPMTRSRSSSQPRGKAKLAEFAKESDGVKKAYPMTAPPAAHGLAEERRRT